MITNVYVDAFNLYYGCLKETPYKWLDILKLCTLLLPANQFNRIRVFAARVAARPGDPSQPERQQIYFRALRTTPNLSIHYGQFLVNRVRMRLADPPAEGPATVEVIKTEEKGSDVNLATYLLLDAMEGDCEAAVVISNDSDLAEPVRQVRKRFGLRVVVLHPCRDVLKTSKELKKAASKSIVIPEAALADAQFPPRLVDSVGRIITKPDRW